MRLAGALTVESALISPDTTPDKERYISDPTKPRHSQRILDDLSRDSDGIQLLRGNTRFACIFDRIHTCSILQFRREVQRRVIIGEEYHFIGCQIAWTSLEKNRLELDATFKGDA